MTYIVMKKIIENGKTSGNLDIIDTQNKLDVFFANNRITQEQYEELTANNTLEISAS